MSTQSDSIHKTIRQYLATRAAANSAAEAADVLETVIKAEMIVRGLQTVECDDKTVTLVHAHRRSFDASLLKTLVKPAVFNAVTKAEVKSSLIDAAVKVGTINKDIVDQVTSTTPYTQIRIH